MLSTLVLILITEYTKLRRIMLGFIEYSENKFGYLKECDGRKGSSPPKSRRFRFGSVREYSVLKGLNIVYG